MNMDDKEEIKASLLELNKKENNEINLEEIQKAIDSNKHYNMLKKKHPNDLHSRIILKIAHESLEEKVAISLWKKLVKHLEILESQLNREVGIAVATMDYFTNILKKISNPLIIDESKSEAIVSISTTDSLTGLYTRAFFDKSIKSEINKRYNRQNDGLSLLLMDIDDFKQVNDTYGHQRGDKVLKTIGEIILKMTRENDIAARYGGEEFAVIMPGCNRNEAQKAAERIRQKVQNTPIDGNINVTVSIGLSDINQNTVHHSKCINNADKALYQSKSTGKNKVTVFKNQ